MWKECLVPPQESIELQESMSKTDGLNDNALRERSDCPKSKSISREFFSESRVNARVGLKSNFNDSRMDDIPRDKSSRTDSKVLTGENSTDKFLLTRMCSC